MKRASRAVRWMAGGAMAWAMMLGGCEKSAPEGTGSAATAGSGEKSAGGAAAAAAGSGAASGTGVGAAGSAGEGAILIGHYGSLTGSEATFGKSTDNGIKMAVADVNKAGGINGRQVKLLTYDTKSESREAGNAVTRLITDDKVVGVLGEVASSRSMAGGAVAQQFQVPMISPSSTNPNVTRGRDYVFRVCFTDDQQAKALAIFVRENLKLDRAAILFDQTQTYSKGLRDDFTKFFTELGGKIVADQPYSGGDSDFSAQLTTIKGADAQIVFVPGYYTEGGNIAIQARRLGLNAPLIGGDGWDSNMRGVFGGAAIEGSYYSNHTAPDQPDSEIGAFIARYKAEFGEEPDALAGLGYDAAAVLFDAMKRSSSLQGPALRGAIAATKDFRGITGVITIDANRNAKKPIVIVQMKRGADNVLRPSYVTGIDPSTR